MSNSSVVNRSTRLLKRLPVQLAWLYGSILLGSILLVLASAYWLNLRSLQQEEDRMVRTMGNLVSLAVGRSSQAGKHHLRRLIEALIRDNPQIESIYVVSHQGKVLAHSNQELRDLRIAPEQLQYLQAKARAGSASIQVVQEGQHWIKELVLPFKSGFERRFDGLLVMRLRVDDLVAKRVAVRHTILIVGLLIAVTGLFLLLLISRKLARPLQNMAAQYSGLLENTPMHVTIYDREGKVLDVSDSFLREFPEHGPGTFKQDWLRIMPVVLAKAVEQDDRVVLEEGQFLAVEYEMPWQGRKRFYETRKFPVLLDENGQVEVMCAMFWDVTKIRRTQAQYELAQQALNAVREGIAITDTTGVIEQVNPSMGRLLGLDESALLGKRLFDFMTDALGEPLEEQCLQQIEVFHSWENEVQLQGKDQALPAWVSVAPVSSDSGPGVDRYVFVFTDLSEKKKQERQVEHLAYYDQLTGLPNRRLFDDRLRIRLSSARRHGKKLALMLLDLDNFKTINDQMGHQAGDQVLCEVANRLRATLRAEDTVARLGGDEFVVILPAVERIQDVASVADKLIEALAEPMEVAGNQIHMYASIGIVFYPDDSEDTSELLQYADLSMYSAKQAGKNRYQFFSREMQEELHARVQLDRELRTAIKRADFVFHYQPKVDLATGHVVGAEALIRWQHPERGLLYPGAFIDQAEKSGLIVPIMRQMLVGLKEDLVRFRNCFGPSFRLAVNISPVEFAQQDFLKFIKQFSKADGWAEDMVELEITENMIMEDVDEAVARMRELSEWGFSLAIDDFGTGFSSLNYLKRFPIDTLKIDQSFLRELPDEKSDVAIVRAMIYMAERLGLEVVAEGVETVEQVRWLHEHGCRTVQGYYFSKPIVADDLLESQEAIRGRWKDALGFVS